MYIRFEFSPIEFEKNLEFADKILASSTFIVPMTLSHISNMHLSDQLIARHFIY